MAAIATQTPTNPLASTASRDSSIMMMASKAPTTSPTTVSTHSNSGKAAYPSRAVGVWSTEEHDRFLEALKKYPQGPWKAITEYIGSRSVRQVQTHAQKYQEKVSRRLHGMQTGKAIRLRREHRIDHDVLALHTLISLPPELRNKHARRAQNHSESKRLPMATAPVAAASTPEKKTELQRPTLVSLDLDEKMFDMAMDGDGTSPSSVSSLSSSFLFDDSAFALMDVDDLPTLSESLDFFIETLA